MSVAKLRIGATPAAMKADEGNDSLDTLIRQAIGKEPLFSFSRTGDGSVQWFQLLHGLEQQDNAGGWPMLTPLKLQKCEKCSREFYAPINYRRHMRLHRRALNFDKESRKYRDLLGAFWDKLSVDEIKEVVSLHDVSIKDLAGSSLVNDLATSLQKMAIWTHPQDYCKAGLALLEVIQGKPSKLPITSQELFSILDDASEKTFLCAGTAESVQKYVFDGYAAKKGLELKNLVACASFLFEQKLVKAWFADKDAEAMRCQKLLFEEEEAAQKRQAELLERKKLKKLRQKEQRAREQSNWERGDLEVPADSFEGPIAQSSVRSAAASESSSSTPGVSDDISSCLELVQFTNNENMDIEAQLNISHPHLDLVEIQDGEPPPVSSRRHFPHTQWQVAKSQKTGRNGFRNSQNHEVQKLEPVQKHGVIKDRGAPVNGSKIWTRKIRVQNGERLRLDPQKEAIDQNQSNCEVMIGSISVPMKNCSTHGLGTVEKDNFESTEPAMLQKLNHVQKPAKHDVLQDGSNGAAVKLWRPVSRHGSGQQDPGEDAIFVKLDNWTSSTENNLRLCSRDNPTGKSKNYTCQVSDGNVLQGLGFCSVSAKAFLSQRWKEAISGDHVRLVLSNDTEVSGQSDMQNGSSEAALPSADQDRGILVKADNQQANTGNLSFSSNGNTKVKFRQKPDKSTKIKYVPKQKNKNHNLVG